MLTQILFFFIFVELKIITKKFIYLLNYISLCRLVINNFLLICIAFEKPQIPVAKMANKLNDLLLMKMC